MSLFHKSHPSHSNDSPVDAEENAEPQQSADASHPSDQSHDDSKEHKEEKSPESSEEKKDDSSGKKKTPIKERLKKMSLPKKIGMLSVILLLLGSAAYFFYDQYKYEGTDDAYVQAYSTQIAPKVSGIVTHVLVIENQQVKAGQILMQIDRKDYVAALRDAEASRGSLEAQYKNAEKDFHRMKLLINSKAISQQRYDQSESNFLNLERQTKAAEARAQEAHLNLEYTSVRAPGDGMIARRSTDIGMYAAAGTAVLGFVPSDERWVDANYKETQLPSIVPGRPAEVTVDAIPGKTFEGVVESISPATGATFTLLPPDNATGNFTKVVQRVPVRIRLKNLTSDDLALLQAGLSAEVNIFKHRAPESLPPPAHPIFAFDEIRTPPPPVTESAIKQGERAGISPNAASAIDEDASDASLDR
jgi:membrane fusion protein (multidrug efflux system)